MPSLAMFTSIDVSNRSRDLFGIVIASVVKNWLSMLTNAPQSPPCVTASAKSAEAVKETHYNALYSL